MLRKLNAANWSQVEINEIYSPEMNSYGKIIEGIDFSDLCAHVITSSVPDKTVYIRDLEILKSCPSFSKISAQIYKNKISLQAGLCFGMNNKMNGMEYHEGSEVIIAVTDLVLILGRKEDIYNKNWDSSLAQCFYLQKGSALEIFGGTLHLAPCQVTNQPFSSIIILPEGTNTPLDNTKNIFDPLLFMNNKWLICHKDSPAVSRGGFIGITGNNIQIKTVEIK